MAGSIAYVADGIWSWVAGWPEGLKLQAGFLSVANKIWTFASQPSICDAI